MIPALPKQCWGVYNNNTKNGFKNVYSIDFSNSNNTNDNSLIKILKEFLDIITWFC
jgi:hypothetical protein